MVKILSSYEILSHQNKLLKNHLHEVADLSKSTIESLNLNFSSIGLDKSNIIELSYILGLCHDFAKSTKYFQDYIRSNKKIKKEETRHGLLSSIFAYYAISEKFKNSDIKDDTKKVLPYIGYIAIKRHHGDLKNLSDEMISIQDEDIETIKKQIESIDIEKLKECFSDSINPELIDKFMSNYIQIISSLKKQKRDVANILRKEMKIEYCILTQLLYSTLISTDKTDASEIDYSRKRKPLDPDMVDKYKYAKFDNDNCKKKINELREDIYKEIIQNLDNIDLDKKIYSINVPTGTGKTLTSLSFALKLRNKIQNDKNVTPRIIYAIPYMSIIDQNYAIFEEIIKTLCDEENVPTDILLKHHHLSDVSYVTSDGENDEEYDTDESLFLIEGWNSEIIVTTYIQLFQTLISNRNKSLRKYHNIVNSIIIMDEVQTIPYQYWELFRKYLNSFANCCNSYIILLTATQPKMFKNNEIIELAKNKEKYFKAMDRVDININLNDISIDELKNKIIKDITSNPDKSYLIVLNTKRTSKIIYDELIKIEDSREKYYLSTYIIPKERIERLRVIKENKKSKIIVSTQLIEAGVDLDVDIVYRDFAPMDSINQVSGRCNRNCSNSIKGLMNLFVLKTDSGKKTYDLVYGNSKLLLEKTILVLKDKKEIRERCFLDIINQYYLMVKDSSSVDRSNDFIKWLIGLNFGEIGKFKLIDDNTPEIDLFVELDDNAKRIWDNYLNIITIKNPIERKKEFIKIKKDFYEYVISVPYSDKDKFDKVGGIYKVNKKDIDEGYYYNNKTGYII